MKAIMRYYTGTGNTARVLGLIGQEMQSAGWTIDSQETWRAGTASATEPADLLILGHPALGLTIPQPFRVWLRDLPPGLGRPAAVVSVVGATFMGNAIVPGDSGYGSIQVQNLLRRKGYRVILARDVSLPENWTQVLQPAESAKVNAIIQAADPQVRQIGRELADLGGTVQTRDPVVRILGGLVAWLFNLVGRRGLGKLFAADASCNGCGLCAKSCPAGTIRMKHQRPDWDFNCSACNRCINICPEKAIQSSIIRAVLWGGLNTVLLVAAIVYARVPGQLSGLLDAAGDFRIWSDRGLAGTVIASLISLLGFLVLYIAGTLIQLGPMEAGLRLLGRSGFGRRLLGWGWTGNFRRYVAPGFKLSRSAPKQSTKPY